MPRRMIFLAVIGLAIHLGSSSTTLTYGQPAEGTKASPPAPAVGDFIEGHYWALIIGVDKYPSLNKDKQLTVARKDAEAVAKLLKERYGFSGERVVELYDDKATRKEIINAFDSMMRRLTGQDSLFIYFAGRGEYERIGKGGKARDGMGYWVPSDAALDDLASGIFNSQVRDYMANIPARHIFAVVDSAFSGDLMKRPPPMDSSKRVLKELYLKKSRWMVQSGGFFPGPDVADKGKGGHSVFAWHFMKILKDNTSPYLLAEDIGEPLAVRVSDETKDQLPRICIVRDAGDEEGRFVFRLRQKFIKQDAADKLLVWPFTYRIEPNDAEEAFKRQQDEIAKKKQEMRERLQKLREEKASEPK